MESTRTLPNLAAELEYLETAQMAVLQAGELLLRNMGQVQVREKKAKDYVTQVDLESQSLIQHLISERFPGHRFIGEESTSDPDVASRESIRLGDGIPSPSDYCWIVDPLDGTTNYIHQLPSFSISIALQYRGEILVGCVHDPVLRETYTAIRHRGAELNGQPIRTSGRRETYQSLVVCSLPTVLVRESPELRRMINILCDSKATLRRLGSAALNLCYIASGRLDAYWTTFASVWDVAAGALILQEAGGTLVHLDGGNFDWNDLQFVAASTRDLGAEMVQLLSIK